MRSRNVILLMTSHEGVAGVLFTPTFDQMIDIDRPRLSGEDDETIIDMARQEKYTLCETTI